MISYKYKRYCTRLYSVLFAISSQPTYKTRKVYVLNNARDLSSVHSYNENVISHAISFKILTNDGLWMMFPKHIYSSWYDVCEPIYIRCWDETADLNCSMNWWCHLKTSDALRELDKNRVTLYHPISFICNQNYANWFINVILVNFWTNDVIGVAGSIFWMILRVYTYDVIISKFHQNRSVNTNSTGGGQNPPPPWWTSRGQ